MHLLLLLHTRLKTHALVYAHILALTEHDDAAAARVHCVSVSAAAADSHNHTHTSSTSYLVVLHTRARLTLDSQHSTQHDTAALDEAATRQTARKQNGGPTARLLMCVVSVLRAVWLERDMRDYI